MSIDNQFVMVERDDGVHLVAVDRIASIKQVDPTRWVATLRQTENEGAEVVSIVDPRLTSLWQRLEFDRRLFGAK